MAYHNQFLRQATRDYKIAKANYYIVLKGYTVTRTSKELGVSRRTLSRWKAANYSTLQKPVGTDERIPVAKFLFQRGYNNKEIATLLTVSNTKVAKWIKLYEWSDNDKRNVDIAGDLTMLSWSFLQFIRDNDLPTYHNVTELIKAYRGNTTKISIATLSLQPVCIDCVHYNKENRNCIAFPAGIPKSIKKGGKHKKPLKGQGNDIVFIQKQFAK